MKIIIALFALLSSLQVQAASTTEWCVWDGEEAIKTAVVDGNESWVNVVQDAYNNGEDLKSDFEGIGSCRFLPDSMGADLKTALLNYETSYIALIPTTAYLKVTGNTVKLVVPSAVYGAGTTLVSFNKDFYSHDAKQCTEQKKTVLELGQQSAGLSQLDVKVQADNNGGVSAVITPSLTTTHYYGICHFHSVN
jgi:hypothetical protein